jgi:hypothetical protein
MKFGTLILLLGAAAASNVETTSLETQAIKAPCVYLDETPAELEYQMEMFSRTLDPRHWTNVQNISKALKEKGVNGAPKLAVKTWELYDKAFSFPRLRRYNFVMENMDMLEHFQDNLNMNISNEVAMQNFLRVATTVKTNLATKYHDGEFVDPADLDPKVEAEKAAAALKA